MYICVYVFVCVHLVYTCIYTSISFWSCFLFFLSFWLCWVFVAAWAFSSCGKWGLHSSCGAQAPHCGGFSCWPQYLWHTDLVVPRLVESSQTRVGAPAVAGGFFFFFNYESTITPLQETWKIQNKVTYSSTISYNFLK